MKILDRDSRLNTLDAFQAADFSGQPWEDEAPAIVGWVADRVGQPEAYAGSFALTPSDWHREFRLFTGEKIVSHVGRAHVAAEESVRMLALIRQRTGLGSEVLQAGAAPLGRKIFESANSRAAIDGMYCCGPCSLAFWEALASGAFQNRQVVLASGLRSLRGNRDDVGGWGRFPFFAALRFLSSLDTAEAATELRYARPRCETVYSRLRAASTGYAARRCAVVERALEQVGDTRP